MMQGFRQGGMGGGDFRPPNSAPQGGISPPRWQEKLKYYIPYFTVIPVQIGHFKHQNLKL